MSTVLMNVKNKAQLMLKSTINRWFVINVFKFSICQYRLSTVILL